MDNALDEELGYIVETVSKLCVPQLHVISFSYAPPIGWRCMIQESRFVEAAMGLGAEPSAAFTAATNDLVERRVKEIDENQG